MPTELQHLKVFNIMQTALDLNLRIISKKYLAGVLSVPPLVIAITKGSIQRPRCSSSKWILYSMTWFCTSINTRWSSDPSRSMFEIHLNTLDKDLQHLQELTAYINVQNQHLLLTKLITWDTLIHYGIEPQ